MASKKKKEIPSVFEILDRKRNEEIAQMSKGSKSTQKFLNQTLAPSSRSQIASGIIKTSNPTALSYGNQEGYVAQRILAPLPTTNKPTTSLDLFNNLKSQNEARVYEQLNELQRRKVEEAKEESEKEKEAYGILKPTEMQDLLVSSTFGGSRQFTGIPHKKTELEKQREKATGHELKVIEPKNGETRQEAYNRINQENTDKLNNYVKTSKVYKKYKDEKNTKVATQYYADLEKVDNEKITTGDKLNPFRSYLSGLSSGLGFDVHIYKDENGNEIYLPDYNKLKTQKVIEESGTIGKAYHGAMQSFGQMTPAILMSLIPVAGTALGLGTTFGTSYTSAYNQKKMEGFSDEQANKYAGVNATLETGLGGLLGGVTKVMGGKSSALSSNIQKLTDKVFNSKGASYLVSHAMSEVIEEEAQNVLDPINEHLTLGKYDNIQEALQQVTLEDAEITALSTLLTVGLTETNTSYNLNTLKKNIDIVNKKYGTDFKFVEGSNEKVTSNKLNKETTAANLLSQAESGNIDTSTMQNNENRQLSQNEQAVIDNIVENRTEELKKSKDKVTKKDISKIEQEVRQDLERGYIETSEIERALSNEEWTKHDKIVKQKEKLENKIKELESKTPQDYKTMGELNSSNEELSKLKEQLSSIDTDTTRGELNSAMQGKLTENDTLLQRAYGEEIEKNNAYQFDKNEKLTEQTKKINEDIEKLGLNNNIKTRDTVDLIKKLSNETGRQYRLIDNNSTEMEKVEGKNVDGFVKNGEVFINVDSENLINRILGHETTHLFEGTEDYTKLQNAAIEYAKTKGEYDSRRSSLEEVYKDIKGANIENELTSDLVGDYLFSDIEFVRNLSTEQPNIFKKMYNYVKHLYNMATAGSKEARQLEQLKYNFEKVYRENNQSKATSETKYSKRLNGFYPEIEVKTSNINKFGINDINNLKEVKEKVYDFYKKKYVSTENQSKPITNIDTGMKIEIWKNGINETFGNANYYKNLSESEKKMKLATMDNLAKMIKYGEIRSKSASNYHNPNSVAEYHYLEHPITIDGVKCMVNIDIRKVPNATGRFYIHSIDTKKIGTPRTSKTSSLTVPISESNIPQNKQKVNSGTSTKYSIQNEEKNAQELDNSSFSNEKKYRGSHQIENAKAITELNINDIENRVKEVDGYLTKQSESDLRKLKKILNNSNEKVKIYRASPVNELNSGDWVTTDKSYAQNVANNNGGKVYTYEADAKQLYYPDNVKDLPSLHRLSSFQYVEETSKPTMYSLSVKEANTGTANNGVKLSKQQQEYFKDSKATDENGNLITVYHTTTDAVPQFNEFNPVGTDYYKFGDQVVNYYTNSKNMSGSYADQEYVMADTKKITSMEEAKSLVKQMNEGLASENTIRIETKDKGYQLVNNIYKEAYEYAKSIWDNEITPEEKQIEKDYEELYKRYVESGYDNNLVPEFTSLENYAKDYAQKLDRITDNMTPEERDAFLSFRKPEFVSVKTEPVIIGEYNSENELFRNLKQDIQKADSIKNKYQYEGYVNITNPYVVDAEGRNWNKVESKEDSKTTTNFLNLDTLTKDRLTQLAKDSKKRYEETYNEYKKWNEAKNSISGNLRNDNDLNTRLGNRFIEESTLPFVKEFINNDYNFEELEKQEKGLGKIHELRVNTDVMYNLYNNDFIPYSVYNEFNNSLVVPEEIREKAKEIINQTATYNEYDSEGHNSIKKQAKLIDIWENYLKSYKAYDNNGRYDYSIFDQQLLDGYLKEELGNNFVVRDEFGTYDWVLKDLYKVASHEFNEDFIRGEYNDWSVTNDIVKSIIALNKAGENYDGVIIKNVVDYGGDSDTHEANDLYITFNSNQFKAADNKTPTDDPDIRYKLSNKNDIAPISNNDIRARDMLLPRQQEIQKAIAPIQEENKVLKQEVETLKKEVRDIQENNAISYEDFEEYNKRIAPLLEEQEAPPEVEQVYDNLKDTTRMPKKEVKLLSKNIKDTLGLTNKQKLDLEEIIQDYSTSETATREDLYNEIKQRYGKQAIITEYEDIMNVQRKVKSMKLDVSDNIKHDIADYNMLKQKNFGKLSFSRNGQPVDSVYQELSSEYPNYFPSNIYNETDQFLKIVDVANLENKSVEELNLDDNYIRETSDYIYESILDSKQDALQKATENAAKESLQGELKAPLPTVLDTSSIDANNVVDEVRLMEHKARKKSNAEKNNDKRTSINWEPFMEIGRKLRAGEDANSIAELNKLDAEAANKQIEEQKKLKPKNESTLKKSLTYGQYLFTNRNVEIDKYAKETGNHNIQVLADHINNIQGEITTNINNSQTDNNGNTIGKSITNIFSQADKAGLSEAFNDYLFHLSNIERHKWGKGSQVPGIDSSILIEEYEKTYPEMKKWAKEVNKYNKNLLYKQADAGLITKDLADNLSKMYEFYVPFMENLEGEYTPDKTNSIKTRSTVKRAKGGSSRNLLSFEDAMIRQTESAITQIRKNQLYQEIVKTKENEATTDFESNTNPDIQGNGLFNDNGKYYLTAYVDGKATQVEIDKSLYHGLAQEGNKRIRQAEQKLSPITKPLQATSNIRRNILTTWNPSFMVTNMLKDIQDAPLNSKYAKDMVKNYPRALKEISTGKGEHLEAFLNMYGQANLRVDYNLDSGLSDITKLAENNKNGKGMKFSKDLLKKIPQINEMIEMAPRYAEYLASIENGCSQMEALYNAREVTTNFGRGGIITKALNRNGFTFLNASVQGMSKLVRNFSGENGGRAVVGCIAKATALGIAPALLNALLFGDDDDYEALPDYIKDNYYLIKTSDKGFIRIPKGRMMSIFGSAARRTLEGIQGRENPYEGYLSNAYNQVGVQNPSESNIFAPLIQAKNNKTWYGTDLVPKRLQTNKEDGTKIPAKDQYDASTDKMSIWLGEKLNISPYKINYVIDQYSGGIGDIILPMMTEEAQSGSDSATGKMVAPLKDKFTADSITDNKYVTNFYSKLEELGEKKNATGSKKDEMSYNYMRNISFEMGSLYAEMRKVQADTTLKDSKKYAKVQNIKAEINRLAEEGMKGYKDVETYDNYARVGDRELYKYQSKDGKTGWSDSSGMYADDINNLGLSIKEKDTYYTTKMEMSNVANKFKEDEGAEKYRAVLKTIRNSKLPSDAKYELYNSWYGKSDETSSIVQGLGISANDYLKFKTADLSSTKNKNGYAVRGSKADKVISYLNKTKLSKGQKAVLYRLAFNYKGNYSSSRYSNAYNEEIVRYIDNSSLTYDESIDALKKLGFKVSKDGTVKWD